jgi:hypothetical protein
MKGSAYTFLLILAVEFTNGDESRGPRRYCAESALSTEKRLREEAGLERI